MDTLKEQPMLAEHDRERQGRDRNNGMGTMTSSYEHERDLLTAALIGVAVGVTATFLLRQGPSGRRPLAVGMTMAGQGARWARKRGMTTGRRAMKGARRGMERGADFLDDVPVDEWKEQIGSYLEAVKGAIEDTVHDELRDLRKSVRRQRRRFGV